MRPRTAEPILARLRQAFLACKDPARLDRLRSAQLDLARIYETGIAPHQPAHEAHRDLLARAYKLERRRSLADQLVIADRARAQSLGASYSERNADPWCNKDLDWGPR